MERKEYLRVFYKAWDAENGVEEAVSRGYRVKHISQSMIPRSEKYTRHYALAIVFEPDPNYKEYPDESLPDDSGDHFPK